MHGFWHHSRPTGKTTAAARRPHRMLHIEWLEDRRLLSGGGLPNVTYHGGPLLQNAQIESVFYGQPWSTNTTLQPLASQVDGFLQYFPTSPYIDALKQYNVGDGAFVNDVVIAQNPPSGQTIDDSQIRQILDSEIAQHQLATPGANSLYVFFTAPGVVVTDSGQSSAKDFAGYHDTFKDSTGAPVYYAVVPYPTGGIAKLQLTDLQQMTAILSHEISEAMTDPDGQTGWFDPRNGEIGDIAEGHFGVLGGYFVQGVWSQAQQQIVVPNDTSTTSIEVNGVPVEATAGQAVTSLVATLTGTPAGTTASSFSATIDWGNGVTSSGTITADPNGGLDISGTNTYAQAGSYAITVSVRDQSGSVVGTALTSATVATKATTAALSAKGAVVAATTGQQFSGVVATFTEGNANAAAGNFTATIDWGDGTTSTGTVTADPNGGFDVSGTHTYAPASSHRPRFPFDGPDFFGSVQDFLGNRFFVISVAIHDTSTNASATALSVAKVAPAPPVITAKGQNLEAVAGQPFSGTVVTFTDTNSKAMAGEFTATIDWGDGTTSTGTVIADPNGGFDVSGSHTYSNAGDWFGFPGGFIFHFGSSNRHFLVSVSITDTQTQDQASAESLATVAPAPPNLAVTAQNIQATSGQSFTGTVATFTDVNTSATAGNFTATINWGDGTSSSGTITADPKGGFDVSGTHTYSLDDLLDAVWDGPLSGFGQGGESFTVTVSVRSTINSDAGATQSLASVTPASANVQGSGTIVSAVFNQTFSGTVATFTPVSGSVNAGSFTATIDWGDGTMSAGTVVANASGGLDVTGSHTYRSLNDGSEGSDWGNRYDGGATNSGPQAFLVAVTVQNATNNTVAGALSLASVTPAPPKIVATSVSLNVPAGASFSGTVASFTDADSNGTANLQAIISWGDGRISLGTVSANGNGGFNIGGTHTYAHSGTYRVFVKIRDADGNSAISLGTAIVGDGAPVSSLTPVAMAFVQSAEYYTEIVLKDYQQFLGRTPGSSEVAGWVNALQHGLSDTQVVVGFLSSPEFYNRAGNNAQGWVDALYREVLGRNADPGGEAGWVQALAAGTAKSNVALSFETSQEHESQLVQSYYQQYLNRAAGAPEIAGWVNTLQHGAANEQVIADFLGSQEYFQGHNANAGDWLSSVYQSVLARSPDPSGYNGWLAVLTGQHE
ncbi:MAG TPA: DUF4214 domain-containing protein [Gemmataceae bacterium]|nr:DUF4214 domain-containing protein [Gemmataceae bacterium]